MVILNSHWPNTLNCAGNSCRSHIRCDPSTLYFTERKKKCFDNKHHSYSYNFILDQKSSLKVRYFFPLSYSYKLNKCIPICAQSDLLLVDTVYIIMSMKALSNFLKSNCQICDKGKKIYSFSFCFFVIVN